MIEYYDDVESDLSVLHRIGSEEIETMEAPRFFRLAERLGVYSGAVAARAAALRAEREQPPAAAEAGRAAPARPVPVETVVRPRLWTRAEVQIGGTA